MNRLEDYGWLKHREEGRTFYYSAVREKQNTRKAMLEDTCAAVFAELNRAVGAPTIDDHDFIRPGDAVKSRTDGLFFVLGNDDGRYHYLTPE